jgi:hypothetical protein
MSPTETTAPSGCEKDTATANRLARAGADHLVCQRSDPHRPPLRALRQLQIILHGQGTRRRKALTGQSSFPSGRGACQCRTSSLPQAPFEDRYVARCAARVPISTAARCPPEPASRAGRSPKWQCDPLLVSREGTSHAPGPMTRQPIVSGQKLDGPDRTPPPGRQRKLGGGRTDGCRQPQKQECGRRWPGAGKRASRHPRGAGPSPIGTQRPVLT